MAPPEDPALKVLRVAEAAARRLVADAAVAAAKLKAEAGNGQHEQIRCDIREVKADVSRLTTSVGEIAHSVLGLQRASLRLFGVASLVGGVLIFILSRALGL